MKNKLKSIEKVISIGAGSAIIYDFFIKYTKCSETLSNHKIEIKKMETNIGNFKELNSNTASYNFDYDIIDELSCITDLHGEIQIKYE